VAIFFGNHLGSGGALLIGAESDTTPFLQPFVSAAL
jgi:hypothetical protein